MPRKSKSQDASPYEAIRRMWELPSFMLFLKLTRSKFGFAKLTIQEFEDQLLENDSIVIADIFTRLLRYFTGKPVVIDNFEIHLQELLKCKNSQYNPLRVNKFVYLNGEEKLQLLKWVVELLFEERTDELSDFFNDNYSPDDLRGEQIGQDSCCNTYWYFNDLRLYRESREKKSGKRDWECVCLTLLDWQTVLESFRNPSSEQEEELYEYLVNDLFPLVEAQIHCLENAEDHPNIELEKDYILQQEKREIAAMVREQDQSTPGSSCSIKQENIVKEEPERKPHPTPNGAVTDQQHTADNGVDVKPKTESSDANPNAGVKEELPLPPLGHDGPNAPSLPQVTHTDGAAQPQQMVRPPNDLMPPSSSALPPPQLLGEFPSQPPVPSVDHQFMQQQSQIFVFDTKLANQAADGVLSGQYKSIIDFHCDQPATKKFLQKHPLKTSQCNRPIYTMANTRPSQTNPVTKGPGPMGEPSNPMASVAEWVQQQNANLQQRMNPNVENPAMSPNSGAPGNNPNMWGGQYPNRPPGVSSPNYIMMPGGPGPGPGPGGPPFNQQMMMGPNQMQQSSNLLQSKVPNDKLTPGQLQRREEQLANLRKIQQMLHLFPDGQNQGCPMPNMGMGVNDLNMGPGGMNPGMFPPDRMPGPHRMMQPGGMNGPPMLGSPAGPNNPMAMGQLPPNWDNMTPEQKEWFKLQQEWLAEKRRRNMMMHGQGPPGMPMGNPGQGPPPPYMMNRRMPGPMEPSPTSPNPNGALPSPHINPGMPGGPNDPQAFMFPGQRRQPFDGPGQPVLNGPAGPMPGRNFDPGMMIGMERPQGMYNFKENMPPKSMPTFHRAGNPEPFGASELQPVGTPTSNSSGPTKPPPSYAQAQKRKRSADDLDELYKKLQPAPSPQQINYLNQFEGQELTITKQVNLAYREQGTGSPAAPPTPQDTFNQNQPLQSPLAGAPRGMQPPGGSAAATNNSNPSVSASAVLPSGNSSMPGTPQAPAAPTPTSAPPTPGSGATQRLSHFDPPPASQPTTPTSGNSSKSSMSNITSASLANLAKGVEHLSNQMQQNMMQGGPFHNIQIQGQVNEPCSSRSSTPPTSTNSQSMVSQQGPQASQQHSQPPSVNNTFVNATMSIQQLNIQSVGNPGFSGPGGAPSMQVQQMNHEMMGQQQQQQQQAMGPMGPAGMPGPPGPPINAMSMSQQMQNSSMMGGPHPDQMMQGQRVQQPQRFPSPMGPQMGPGAGPQMPGGPPIPSSGPMPVSSVGMAPSGVPPASCSSPGYRQPSTPVGNASVQIQAKAPNTIQYLPANPPSSQHDPMMTRKSEFEMMQRFQGPPGQGMPGMEPRMPGSKMPPGPGGPEMFPPDLRMHMPAQSPHMGMQPGMMMPNNEQIPGMQYGGPSPGAPHPGMMGNDMVQAQQIQMQSQQMSMHSSSAGPMPPQGMRPDGPAGMMPNQQNFSAHFQQFQQQMYSQSRTGSMMGPGNGGMMGSPNMGQPMGPPTSMCGPTMGPGMSDPQLGPMSGPGMVSHPGMPPAGMRMGVPGMGPGGPPQGMIGPGMGPNGMPGGPGQQYSNMMQGPL